MRKETQTARALSPARDGQAREERSLTRALVRVRRCRQAVVVQTSSGSCFTTGSARKCFVIGGSYRNSLRAVTPPPYDSQALGVVGEPLIIRKISPSTWAGDNDLISGDQQPLSCDTGAFGV